MGKSAYEISIRRHPHLAHKLAIQVLTAHVASHPNYKKYSHLLSPGWIPGRELDNSDDQYSGFRDNLKYLSLLVILHPLLRRLSDYIYYVLGRSPASPPSDNPNGRSPPGLQIEADTRLNQRVSFDIRFSVLFISALHGISALKILLILYINFSLATKLPKKYVPAATWIFNVGLLFANELFEGYPLASVTDIFLPWSTTLGSPIGSKPDVNWGAVLDSYGGLLPRWGVLFKITVLRLISFNLDYCWSLDRSQGSPIEVCHPYVRGRDSPLTDNPKKKQLNPKALSERDRVSTPTKTKDYTFPNYLAYTLYTPLYIAGPILTFNDYISQQRYPLTSITTSRTFLYGMRFILALLTMEIMLHFFYVIAISKAQPAWDLYTPFQLSMIGYFSLHHIWLKLLLPWRFFRLWALLDGIDPPENMVRCMSDNYSALAFWRGWHRSFNRWTVRYVYVPLGGSGSASGPWATARTVANMLVVFTFVALWHDIQLRLLVWGWLVTLFILPEVGAGYLFPAKNWKSHPNIYSAICGAGAVANVLMMMAANLVGFAVGWEGLKGLVNGIAGSWEGMLVLVAACSALFLGAQVMFQVREREVKAGIRLKC